MQELEKAANTYLDASLRDAFYAGVKWQEDYDYALDHAEKSDLCKWLDARDVKRAA